MAFLVRRLVVSLLLPYLWQRWRRRSRSQPEAAPAPLHDLAQPRTAAVDVISGRGASAEY